MSSIRIAVLSDTHGYFDPQLPQLLKGCDEVWHAGDIGDEAILDLLGAYTVRAVYGNIDDPEIRSRAPEYLFFELAGAKVLILHEGGVPERYRPRAKELIEVHRPSIFVCGHSHILNVARDAQGILFINPGACGLKGFHTKRTFVRFVLEAGKVSQAEVVELDNPAPRKATEGLTVTQYLYKRGRSLAPAEASRLGKLATQICNDNGWPILKTADPRYGVVNVYPQEALDEAFGKVVGSRQ